MAYKWKPSKAQRKEFALRMQDPDEKAAYESRKAVKAERKRAGSRFDYAKAGGSYIPTKEQYDFCMNNMQVFVSAEEVGAANMVISGYVLQDKVHHDFIHIVNDKRRSQNIFS